jgi:glycosyltransferase involved in cell wall biosynthesis
VLIEALACGSPIVSTDCPHGPREILADGEYGRLVTVGDAAALADAVLETLDDPGSADERRERSEDFAPEAVLDDYEQFIRRYVLTPRSGR